MAGGLASDRGYHRAARRDTSKLLVFGLPVVVVGVALIATVANRRADVVENAGALSGDTRPALVRTAATPARLSAAVPAGDTPIASAKVVGPVGGARREPRAAVIAPVRPRAEETKTWRPAAAPKESDADAAAIGGEIERFVRALNRRDAHRVTALYATESDQDKQNLEFLLGALRRPRTNLRADALSVAAPQLGWTEATAVFTIRLSWKPAIGAQRLRRVTFVATLENVSSAADGWRLVGVRALERLQ